MQFFRLEQYTILIRKGSYNNFNIWKKFSRPSKPGNNVAIDTTIWCQIIRDREEIVTGIISKSVSRGGEAFVLQCSQYWV